MSDGIATSRLPLMIFNRNENSRNLDRLLPQIDCCYIQQCLGYRVDCTFLPHTCLSVSNFSKSYFIDARFCSVWIQEKIDCLRHVVQKRKLYFENYQIVIYILCKRKSHSCFTVSLKLFTLKFACPFAVHVIAL